MEKKLDRKLANLHANPGAARDFILADAKDADMAFGLSAPGQSPEYYGQEGKFRSLTDYRDLIRQVARQGLVDIVVMSASTSEVLTIEERIFDRTTVTPATRANDTTDIYAARGARYAQSPSKPFQTASIAQMQCGKAECLPEEYNMGSNLGLYSITYNNDVERDHQSLEAYKQFRLEAEEKGFRHFLEVFDPNVPTAIPPELLGHFINDQIVRTLAGVPKSGRPIFLKIVYHGPKFMEQLAAYDPHLIPGILGGASGTTYDAFKLLAEAKKYGARVGLYGRKINNVEHQLAFIEFLRLIADDQISPEEAVAAYHGVLQKLGVAPYRSLAHDLQLTNPVMSYIPSAKMRPTIAIPAAKPASQAASKPESSLLLDKEKEAADYPHKADGELDFSKFTPAQRIKFNEEERDRVYGRRWRKDQI
jgi:hypothetical protein